ncbi:hypothetical protein P1X14_22010, partial [Sphingomonas sp. AOB5]|uniref:hypothetical protein n=1 Tax=Sphingomonas sp. AOB5 TaxID=3034017 RepID=UPI0023F95362
MASMAPTGGDPRVTPPSGDEQSVAPQVALPRGGPSWIVIAIGMAILGVILFSVLDSRRRSLEAPAVKLGASDRPGATTAAVPPALYVPPAPVPVPVVVQPAPQQL